MVGGKGLQRDMKELFRVVNVFTILIMVIVSRVYTYVKTYPIVYFEYVWMLMYVNYVSIKL